MNYNVGGCGERFAEILMPEHAARDQSQCQLCKLLPDPESKQKMKCVRKEFKGQVYLQNCLTL